MPPFDALTIAAARDQGLGDAAAPLVRETASLIAETPGGLAGFLDRFRRGGLGAVVETWLGRTDAAPLAHEQVEHILGAVTVSGIAGRVGIGREAAGTALGQLIPRVCGLLSPGGVAAATVPAELAAYLGDQPVAAPAGHAAETHGTPSGSTAPAPDGEGKMAGGWVGAMVACAVGICVVAWLMLPPGPKPAPVPARVETPAAPAAKVQAPAPPAVKVEAQVPSLPARLELTAKDGTVTVAGAVHDEATRASILDLLHAVFGADAVRGDLTVDPARLSASWMPGLRAALEALKGAGPRAVFEGNGVTVDGLTSRSGRDGLLFALRAAMGSGMDVSVHLLDKIQDLLAVSSDATASGLAALPEGFSPDALVKVLNLSIVNFDSGSFAIPDSATELLRQAAAHIKQLPAGTKLLVAGYTDNTGDPDANLRLSGQRAGAVRDFLAADGVDAAMLDAKGFGADSPVAPNDSVEGRFRNRRIEYRLAP